jgi:hypothetical protein
LSDIRHTSTYGIDDILANCSSESSAILTTHNRQYLSHTLKELWESLLAANLTRINKAVSECFVSAVQELL